MTEDEMDQLTNGQDVLVNLGNNEKPNWMKGTVLCTTTTSAGTYAEVLRERGRWNNDDRGLRYITQIFRCWQIKLP